MPGTGWNASPRNGPAGFRTGRCPAVFSAAALKCRARDAWVGWDFRTQYGRLHLVSNNTRLLLLPGRRHRNLGSRVLGLCARRIVRDWPARFGLVKRRILESEEGRLLWAFRTRRYPTVDGKAEREVKLRIMQVLVTDEIPGPRDIVIICLADACRIFNQIMPEKEVAQVRERIDVVRRMDLIGQAVSTAVRDIETSLAATAYSPF